MRCVSEAPLGVPVVPLVYWMSARSSVAGLRVGRRAAARVPTIDSHETVPLTRSCSAVARLARLRDRQAAARAGCRSGIAWVMSTEISEVTARSAGNSCTVATTLRPDDRVLRAVVLELLAQLARRVERVVLDDDGAEPQDRVERDDVLRAVRQHDRDRVARPARPDRADRRPRGRSRRCSSRYDVVAAEELQGGRVRVVAGGRLDDVDERSGDGLEVVRHPLGVAGDPGARRLVRRHALSLGAGVRRRRARSRTAVDLASV